MTLAQIRAARAAKVAAARALLTTAETEQRSMTAEQAAQFATLQTEIAALEADESRQVFLDDAERRTVGVTVNGSGGDTYAQLESQVRVLDVIRSQMEGRALSGAAAEWHSETERRTGRRAQGVFVPLSTLETRVNTTTSAPELVATQHRADLYIQPLRNRLLARRLGARVLSNLEGNIVVPKYGTGVSVGWVAENAPVPESDLAPDSVTMSPKTVGGVSEISRRLVLQSSPDVEDLLRDDFAYAVAKAIDSALIKGGGPNEPNGVLSTVGI